MDKTSFNFKIFDVNYLYLTALREVPHFKIIIISDKMANDIWFEQTPQWMDTMTISQLLDAIEGTENWGEEDKKTYTLNHLKGQAAEFSKTNITADMDWNTVKLTFFQQFQCHIG